MVMNALRTGKSGAVLKFILFGLLILAMGGMVFTDVGGFFRNGITGSRDVATIGTTPFSIVQFDHMARKNLERIGMSPAQAYKMGYLREMLNGEVRARLLSQKAVDLGLEVTTEEVAKKLKTLLEPMTDKGQKPLDVMKQILQAQGMSEQAFLENMKNEMATSFLSDAMKGGFAETSHAFLEDMNAFQKEERAIEYIAFPDSEFSAGAPPSESQLQELYNSTKEAYATPAFREAQLILVKKDPIRNTVTVSESDIQDSYNKNKEMYEQPETRTIEQTILTKAGQAEDILKSVKAGKPLKDAVKTATGHITDYLPPETFNGKTIPAPLKEAVFSGKKGDVIGPITTPLGTQIAVIQDITPATLQKLDNVKETIRKELLETKIQDALYSTANTIDDMLAAGTPLEDLKKEVDIEVIAIPPVTTFGLGKDEKPALNAFGEDTETLLKTLFDLNEGEASPVFELKDGRMAALLLETITPKQYKPFPAVKDSIRDKWVTQQKHVENKLALLKILEDLKADKLTLKDAAQKYKKPVQNISGLLRSRDIKPPLTPQAMGSVFEAPQGELVALDLENGPALAHVTSVKIPEKPSKDDLAKIKPEILRSFENEGYALYIEKQRKAYGVKINDRLLEQTYGQEEPE